MGIVVQRKGRHQKVGFVKDWRVDVSVAERNMTKMVRNRVGPPAYKHRYSNI